MQKRRRLGPGWRATRHNHALREQCYVPISSQPPFQKRNHTSGFAAVRVIAPAHIILQLRCGRQKSQNAPRDLPGNHAISFGGAVRVTRPAFGVMCDELDFRYRREG